MSFPRSYIKVGLSLYAKATNIVFNSVSKYTQGRLDQVGIMSANKALLFRNKQAFDVYF